MNLTVPYHEYFETIRADDEWSRSEAFRLRYLVYSVELGWEDSMLYPDQQERDRYDSHSLHYLIRHRPSGQLAGTVRLVRTFADLPEASIPIEDHYTGTYRDTPFTPANMKAGNYGEISRLALTQKFRKRTGESRSPYGLPVELNCSLTERRRFPHISLGLYLAAAASSLHEGLQGVFAMMEPRLARHLGIAGINFVQVGEPIEFRGKRAPFYISREALTTSLSTSMKELMQSISDELDI